MKKCVVLLVFSMFLLSCWDNTVSPEDDGGGSNATSSCTVGNSCTNNVLQSNCAGTFRANQTCPPQLQVANAVRITLTHWSSTATDGLFSDRNLDPRIHFTVTARRNGSSITSRNTDYLLDDQDIGQSWNGTSRSAWIPFDGTADSLLIIPTVVEKDLLDNDDISPGRMLVFVLPVYSDRSGNATLGTATSTQSEVRFNYEFTRQ